MIIQCEQCQTKFRLDDSKVKDTGVKVRCAKCKHVFAVTREQAVSETDNDSAFQAGDISISGGAASTPEISNSFDGLLSQIQESDSSISPAADESPEPVPQQPIDQDAFDYTGMEQDAFTANGFEIPSATDQVEDDPFNLGGLTSNQTTEPITETTETTIDDTTGFDADDFDFVDTDIEKKSTADDFFLAPQPDNATAGDLDLSFNQPATADELSLSSLDADAISDTGYDSNRPEPGEIDFDGFDFGDSAPDADSTIIATPTDATETQSSVTTDDFDFQINDFGETSENIATDNPAENPALSSFDESFMLGEIDFGDELSTVSNQGSNPEDLKAGIEFGFGSIEEPVNNAVQIGGESLTWTAPAEPLPAEPVSSEPVNVEDLPPIHLGWGGFALPMQENVNEEPGDPAEISLRFRRRLIMIILLMAAFFVGLGAIIRISLPPKIDTIQPTALPTPTTTMPAATEIGKITLRSEAKYILNATTGTELLVITGEAVNEFPTARTAIQIRGIVYGDNKQPLTDKAAYCGNILTDEQLAKLPLDKIEAAMANRAASIDVAPGKSIPFMIVIASIPENAKGYDVILGSAATATKEVQTVVEQ